MATTRAGRWRRRLLRAGLCLLLGAVTTVGAAWAGAFTEPSRSIDLLFHDTHERWTVTRYGNRLAECIWIYRRPDGTAYPAVYPLSDAPLNETVMDAARRTLQQPPVSDLAATPIGARLKLDPRSCPAPGNPAGVIQVGTFRNGWPARSLIGFKDMGGSKDVYRGVWPAAEGQRPLPYLPLLPGVLFDTLVYAVPWWALLASPGLVKRWRRKRRGACLACGYDLRGLGDGTACPECGSD